MMIPVRISLGPRPSEIAKFKKLKHYSIDLPIERSVYAWHEAMSVLYGLPVERYVARRFGSEGLLFEMDDLLSIVDPLPRDYEGMTRARFYFTEALDSGREPWGDEWFDAQRDYNRKTWHEEVDTWLADIGETEYAVRWHAAVDLAIEASRRAPSRSTKFLRRLGRDVRELVEPWGKD